LAGSLSQSGRNGLTYKRSTLIVRDQFAELISVAWVHSQRDLFKLFTCWLWWPTTFWLVLHMPDIRAITKQRKYFEISRNCD